MDVEVTGLERSPCVTLGAFAAARRERPRRRQIVVRRLDLCVVELVAADALARAEPGRGRRRDGVAVAERETTGHARARRQDAAHLMAVDFGAQVQKSAALRK